jgi:hypothetical protein
MSKNVRLYTNDIIKTLKNVARANAVREGSKDEGFKVKITKNDIKEGTDRERIKESVLSIVVNTLNSSGFDADESKGVINVFVPPVLGKKEVFTLNEIKERESVGEEINAEGLSSFPPPKKTEV